MDPFPLLLLLLLNQIGRVRFRFDILLLNQISRVRFRFNILYSSIRQVGLGSGLISYTPQSYRQGQVQVYYPTPHSTLRQLGLGSGLISYSFSSLRQAGFRFEPDLGLGSYKVSQFFYILLLIMKIGIQNIFFYLIFVTGSVRFLASTRLKPMS